MSRPEAPFAVCWSSVEAMDAAHDVIEAAQRFADAFCDDVAAAPTSPALLALVEAVRRLAWVNVRVRREWGEDDGPDATFARRLGARVPFDCECGHSSAKHDGNRCTECECALLFRPLDVDAGDECAHEWVSSGTNDGGDDARFHGEGRTYCLRCGADGDA